MKKNKQRLTQITPREKKAAHSGGCLDERIPAQQIRQRLADEPREFDVDAVLPVIANQAAWARMMAINESVRMTRGEVIQQARDTVEVIDELVARISNLHPDLACWATDALFKSGRDGFRNLTRRLKPDLSVLRAAVNHAGATVQRQPKRTGPKQNRWMIARDNIGRALREHSTPAIPTKAAKALAADLLQICELPSPRQGQ